MNVYNFQGFIYELVYTCTLKLWIV